METTIFVASGPYEIPDYVSLWSTPTNSLPTLILRHLSLWRKGSLQKYIETDAPKKQTRSLTWTQFGPLLIFVHPWSPTTRHREVRPPEDVPLQGRWKSRWKLLRYLGFSVQGLRLRAWAESSGFWFGSLDFPPDVKSRHGPWAIYIL